jgi:hypothetical protein
MGNTPTPDTLADDLVTVDSQVPGGGHYVTLHTPGAAPVCLGPYLNRDVAKLDAARVRRFVAAVIRVGLGGKAPAA